ncbi:MAG: hypothetical protein IT395_04840 [Candidatus Omnitrophica bacterium]|nr:hypothetical protein [Candidatus Omnitrophota bacterium]
MKTPFSHLAGRKVFLPAVLLFFISTILFASDGPERPVVVIPTVKTVKSMTLGSLDRYQSSAKDDPVSLAIRADDILNQSREVAAGLTLGDPKTKNLVGYMMSSVDQASSEAGAAYNGIRKIYADIEVMKTKPAPDDQQADRAANYRRSVERKHDSVAADRGLLDGITDALGEIADNSKDAPAQYEKVAGHLKEISNRFDGLAKNLIEQESADPASVAQAKQYFSALQDHVKNQKPYASRQADYLNQAKNYIDKIKKYSDNTLKDLDKTKSDLIAMENYFRSAKVGPQTGGTDIAVAPDDAAVCANAETKGLKSREECPKSCRGVCRWKEKVNGVDCYECPSGSPGSCFDVGAWPDNHPWCQPGGICHDDPMMFCSPFGTMSPNKEPLNCTKCQKRPDMCWQKVGDGTTTLTNCKLGCGNGKCVYKGKYEEFEWDGKSEKIHCYKCELPPPPPTCEDLGWGSTWKSDCEKMCPAPGQCVKNPKSVPGAPGAPPAAPGDGEDQGKDGEQGEEGETRTGDNSQSGGQGGKPAEPPTGTPTQPGGLSPSGGGGTVAGGGQPAGQPGSSGGGQQGGDAQPPKEPDTTQPRQPDQPNTGDKPQPPEPPAPPPDTPEISFYKDWLTETEERIKSREDIINDPNEGDATKDEARNQLESMTRERDKVQNRVTEEQQKELDKIKDAEERKKRAEEFERTRERPRDYAEEARKRGEAWLLNQLKTATDTLQNKLTEARDAVTGRQERLTRIRDEITQLENENKYYKENEENETFDSDFTQTRIKQNQARINELKKQYAELEKKLKETINKYNEELERLKSDYRRALWAYDKKSQARADAERTDEYFERYSTLQHTKAVREERNRTFNEIASDLETQIRDKKAKGEDADDLERQLENLRRGQKEWDDSMQRQEDSIGRQLHELDWRNFYEGAGPSSADDLGASLTKYGKQFESQLADTRKMIAELEGTKNRTSDQNKLLESLRSKVTDLKNSIDAVAEKQTQFKGGLTTEEQQRVHETTVRVAGGAMKTDAGKSFARLALESLGEEAVHNMNPLVAAKKSLAFGVGVVQGVGSAVKGLVELGVGAVDLTMEVYLTNLGFDIETDALDAVNGMLDTVSSNANFDGVIKAVVAAGGAIDAKINELSKGDIDWNTSNFGGKVTGELFVGDAVIAGAVGKAGKAMGLIDDAVDTGRVVGKLDEGMDAARTGTRAGEAAPTRGPPSSPKTELVDMDVPGSAPAKDPTKTAPVDIEVPGSKLAGDAPSSPATATRGGVAPNSQASYVGADGKTVTVKTGEELGHGSTSVVYADPNDATKAIRITEPGRGGIKSAPQLDAAGRQAVESIQTKNGPIRIAEKGTPTMVTDPNSPLNGKIVETVERVKGGSADKLLNGGPMSQAQAEALDLATRELNNKGYAWMDNHAGNYGFEDMGNGKLRVVVLDPGGIVPMKGLSLEEKARNARALQQRLIPEEGTKEFLDMMDQRGPDARKNFVDRERGAIMGEHAGNIDAAAMGINSPYDIAFYPMGTLGFDNAQALSRMSPAEAAAYYGARK